MLSAPRPALRLAGVLAVLTLVAFLVAPASAVRERTIVDDPEPLQVSLTTLTPSVVPRSGPVQLTGSVRNVSDQTWQDINVHTWVSTSPITTREDLSTAAATSYDADVGERLTSAHGFVGVGDLAPGAQTTFSLRVPRDELEIPQNSPGVYWIGIQVLGTGDDGRQVAGRARTFVPEVAGNRPRAAVSLVLPFRAPVLRDGLNGDRLLDQDTWADLIGQDGRLDRLLGVAGTASASAPVTLVVDPAVLDAVQTLAGGNDATAERARDWLNRMRTVAAAQSVLGLGYADPDTAALARHAPGLLAVAAAESASAFARYGITANPAVVPEDGSLAPRFLDQLDARTTVVLSDSSVPDSAPLARTRTNQPLVVTDAQASEGGPSPTAGTDALAERQRILAEASLHRTGLRDPLVVTLPDDWDPGADWSDADLLGGLDVPWLRLVRPEPDTGAPMPDRIVYGPELARQQIATAQVDAVSEVRRRARVFADAVVEPGDVLARFTRTGLEGASYHARDDRRSSLDRTRRLADGLRDRLSGVRVEGVPLVTMSGGSGTFTVTLVNGLARPVRVGLRARTSGGGLRITAPAAQVLPANQRTTVKLSARAGRSRVRSVTLTPETSTGYAVGTPFRFSVRNSRVSSLVWGVMAGAFALLLLTIVRRAVKRGLHRETPLR